MITFVHDLSNNEPVAVRSTMALRRKANEQTDFFVRSFITLQLRLKKIRRDYFIDF